MRIPLLKALFTTTTIVTFTLVWFGFRTAEQEQRLTLQRNKELLENAADTAAAGIRARLAEAKEKLSKGEPIEGAIVVILSNGRLSVKPEGKLAFVPEAPSSPSLNHLFLAAEKIEFSGSSLEPSINTYRQLGNSPNSAIRAEALLRLARALRKSGLEQSALEAYKQLSTMNADSAAGLPAALVGLDGLHHFQKIADSIDQGQWLLNRGAAEFYRSRAGDRPKPVSWLMAEAMQQGWGQNVLIPFKAEDFHAVTLWQTIPSGSAGMVAETRSLVELAIPAGYRFTLNSTAQAGPGALRLLGDTSNPWSIRILPERDHQDTNNSALLLAMIALMILFLWGTVYFMAKAVRREAKAAQLQSDFVASVSHEFRSPLTTVRQLSEMLEMDQVPSDERRHQYYQMLSKESMRLQRLVETLLNFGKLESGEQQLQFSLVDVGDIVGSVLAELEGSGRVSVECSTRLEVSGDKESLCMAIRNLIENALKYSPSTNPVEVRFGKRQNQAFLEVSDSGPGVPFEERERVFEKFVRGQSAVAANIKGTGIGLALVKQIMLAHGGQVTLHCPANQGATFTLLWNKSR